MSATTFTTRLRIADQREIINQIAQTYKDFYRAAMEYVDNAIDAAVDRRENKARPDYDPKFVGTISVNVDTKKRSVIVKDDCGGMTPRELCNLLSQVGRSGKKTVPWTNGQFGFGVHAFRAFARTATFTSNAGSQGQYSITIDRETDENTDVICKRSSKHALGATRGTLIEITDLDKHVFRKAQMRQKLVQEIERHFSDPLRAGIVKVRVLQDNAHAHECKPFDFESLPGIPIEETLDVFASGREGKIVVNLKVLEKQLPDDSHLPCLTKKGRRIQAMAHLNSFRNFMRDQGGKVDVWSTLFVTGSIDVEDFCDPNITRDDLRPDARTRAVYEALIFVQMRLEEELEQLLQRHAKASLKKVGDLVSALLRDVLKRFRLQFEISMPTSEAGTLPEGLEPLGQAGGLGGREAGGGGPTAAPGGTGDGSGDANGQEPPAEPGPEATGGGGRRGQSTETVQSKHQAREEAGPQITFRSFPGQNRVIELAGSLVVNTSHEDFKIRNRGNEADIKFDDRLINYVAMIITPPCVHRIVEKAGKVLSPKEIADNAVNLATELEKRLIESKKALQSSVA